MGDFGIPGYRARWLTGRTAVAEAHGSRLAGLTGRPLTRVWLAWDLTDDSWWADCPVLLDFAGEQVEVNHWKFDEVTISWNTVDPARGVGGRGWTTYRSSGVRSRCPSWSAWSAGR